MWAFSRLEVKMFRYDAGSFGAYRTENGQIRTDATPITRTGVFTYINPDGTKTRELRHPDDVFKKDSLKTFEMLPITNDHPSEMVTPENISNYQKGNIGENVRQDGHLVVASLIVSHKDAIEAIEKGKRGWSLGYKTDVIEEEGMYKGEKYDHRQTNIIGNHLAIVDVGRAGPEARLKMDSADAVIVLEDKLKLDKDKTHKELSMITIKLDSGVSYEVPPEVGAAFEVNKKDMADNKAKIEELEQFKLDSEKEKKALQGKHDALEEKYKKLEKKDHSEDIKKAVKERTDVLATAKSVLPGDQLEKLDEMDTQDIKKAIIVELAPEKERKDKAERLDSVEDDYLNPYYAGIVEGIPKRDAEAINRYKFVEKNDEEDAKYHALSGFENVHTVKETK